jgi:hypothetical protein
MKSRKWRRQLRPALLLVAALAVTFALASPANAVELQGSCNGWDTVGSKNIGGRVYSVQARSCVEKSSTTGAIRAHTGVRFLRSGSGTTAFLYGRFRSVELWRTPFDPQLAASFNSGIGDPGGSNPGLTISGYSNWRCGEPHEFWTLADFDYTYPDGQNVIGKFHLSNTVNVNPDC